MKSDYRLLLFVFIGNIQGDGRNFRAYVDNLRQCACARAVYVCVCVRERERERVCVCVCVRACVRA